VGKGKKVTRNRLLLESAGGRRAGGENDRLQKRNSALLFS